MTKPAARKRELDPYTLGVVSRRFKLRYGVLIRCIDKVGKTNPFTEGRLLELDLQADNLRAEARALESLQPRKSKQRKP